MDGRTDMLISVRPRKHSFYRDIKIGKAICPEKHESILKLETVKCVLAAKSKQLFCNKGMFYRTYSYHLKVWI